MTNKRKVTKRINATKEFWEKVDKTAQRELLTRDELIIEVLEKHCNLQEFLINKAKKVEEDR